MKKKNKLTVKQRRFVELYNGNATEAAIGAGYSPKTAYSQGQRLLKHVEVGKVITNREDKRVSGHIASREERQKFWTDKMHAAEKEADQLRASELLGRSEGDFIERREVTGEMTIDDIRRDATDDAWAEYQRITEEKDRAIA